MKRRILIASFVFAWIVGVSAYFLYEYPASILKEPALELSESHQYVIQAPANQPHDSRVPPPPPAPASAPVSELDSEPQRTLIGTTSEHLREMESYLPDGARIATYPVSDTNLKPAFLNADLDGDGQPELIVVHTEGPPSASEPTPQLILSVLTIQGGHSKLLSSTRLVDGGVLFDINISGYLAPLVVRDVTGDTRPEVLVASGMGASLGGVLQVYTVIGTDSRRVASVGGHLFYVQPGRGKIPSELRAKDRDEDKALVYKWNGQRFE